MRRILAACALVSLLFFSGCAGRIDPASTGSPSPTPDASPSPPALPDVSELEPLQLNPPVLLGAGAGEPNIAFAPDGTVYVTPIDHVYRSTDGGKSFEDLGTSQTEGHGDGDIVVDDSGRLHWLGLFGASGPIPYQYSDNQGDSFSEGFDASNGTGSDREWLDVSPDGHVYAGWRDADGYVVRVKPGPTAAWRDKVTVMGDALGGPVIHDPSNATRLFLPVVTFGGPLFGGGTPALEVVVSEDEGVNWTRHKVMDIPVSPADVIFTTQIFPVAAVDANGTVYLVVSVKKEIIPAAVPKPVAPYGVLLFVSQDHGATWSTPQLVSDPLKVGIMPWIAAGAPGRIVMAWYENTVGIPNDVLPDAWNVVMVEGLHMDRASAAQDTLRTQMNELPLHVGSVCTNGTLCIAGGDRCLLDFFEVAIGPDGQPGLAWASCHGGTGVGLAAVDTTVYARTVLSGTPLK